MKKDWLTPRERRKSNIYATMTLFVGIVIAIVAFWHTPYIQAKALYERYTVSAEMKSDIKTQLMDLENAEQKLYESIEKVTKDVEEDEISLDKLQQDIRIARQKAIKLRVVVLCNEKLTKHMTDTQREEFNILSREYVNEIENFDKALNDLDAGIELLKDGGSCGEQFYSDVKVLLSCAVTNQFASKKQQKRLREYYKI
jgi:hypothetical protein